MTRQTGTKVHLPIKTAYICNMTQREFLGKSKEDRQKFFVYPSDLYYFPSNLYENRPEIEHRCWVIDGDLHKWFVEMGAGHTDIRFYPKRNPPWEVQIPTRLAALYKLTWL